MVAVYQHFLKNVTKIESAYNAGFENISIMDIAGIGSKYIPCKINVLESNDPRSYRQSSARLIGMDLNQKSQFLTQLLI